MSNSLSHEDGLNYRALYGKLFSGLLHQFGIGYVSEIEDAIQNTFLKSLKIWNKTDIPDNKENWLFIVARNDVLNQIQKRKREDYEVSFNLPEDNESSEDSNDLRLQTIIFLALLKNLSNQAKVLFTLKNIFGLSIAEISSSTLIGQEAIYKSINRTKKRIISLNKDTKLDLLTCNAQIPEINIAEEIFYAVFTIGFDSFSEKTGNIINQDLCLEALALTKLLNQKYKFDSTAHLLALFCFHSARIPAKVERGKIIPFFNQNREKWNKELIYLGFKYLNKPAQIHKYYLEAVIISKYMFVEKMTENDWKDIAGLYRIMMTVTHSPITKLNYCFSLSKIGEIQECLNLFSELEKELPDEHVYFALVKAKILEKINSKESESLLISVFDKLQQRIRKEYLLENENLIFTIQLAENLYNDNIDKT